ncbi:hypothetical protein FBUS_01882 [Fasciolopsis buskii]|uniref:PLAT domain-containing protein n=1 Tax=Fasciolopsis buskii TaxID=27845 RepID=A0A8E0VP57_9TREM|nr:hypothetical protein FBUS_01882 [Fasciolopsis buski]
MWLNAAPWQRSAIVQPQNRITFGRGTCVQVRLPPCQQYGPLTHLTIGHSRRGPSSKWHLEKVIVDDLRLNRVYEFPCNDWVDNSCQKQLKCLRTEPREMSEEDKWRSEQRMIHIIP